MFRAVKHKHFPRYRLRSNEVRILWHVTCPIDFPLMVDALYDLNPGLWRDAVAAEFSAFVIVVRTIESIRGSTVIALGELDCGNLKVVLCLARRMCTEEKAVGGIRLIRRAACC